MEKNRHFNAIVVGENPDDIMKKYDLSVKVEPYAIYKLADAGKYKQNSIIAFKQLVSVPTLPESIRDEYKERIKEIESMSDVDFYLELAADYQIDKETGDAMCDINPNGYFTSCNIGRRFAVPFITKDGKEVYQARMKDIDWDKVHLANQETYRAAWEMVMGDRKPVTEDEKIIYNNMKNRQEYFKFFGDEETYVVNNTAFWGYAFVTKDNWTELTDDIRQVDWVGNFYDNFIVGLPEDTLITIYECVRD